jgi:3',5'-cyclic AMP phosphodiesterase CpdA
MKKLFLLLTIIIFGAVSAPAAKMVARIALLSDPHVNRATNGMDATFKPHFEKTIAMVNSEKVDFVLIAGDLTQDGKPEEIDDFKNHLKKFKAPVFYAPGNHDVGHKFDSGKKDGTVTAERVEFYEKKLGPSFFAKTKSGVRIIGVNSSILGSGFERENDQWKFLEKQFAKPNRKPALLFMHYPMFVKDADEPGGVYWNVEPAPRAQLLNLLKQGGVKTVLTGHLHKDLVNRHDGMLLLSTRPISFGLPRDQQPEGWTLVTMFANGEATYELKAIERSPQ